MSEVDPGATPHGRVAFDFARALIAGDFDSSYQMLAPAFQDE